MQIKEKRVAAALAAVELYLQQEEAEAETQRRMIASEQGPVAAIDPGHWAQAGRLEMMSVRRMMQMRAFSRTR